jgi:hypothetical protein
MSIFRDVDFPSGSFGTAYTTFLMVLIGVLPHWIWSPRSGRMTMLLAVSLGVMLAALGGLGSTPRRKSSGMRPYIGVN